MCGIVGIHSLEGQRPVPRDVLAAMNETIRHRGPDSDGFHVEHDRVGLAMRRLAIIDVAGGDQPIANEDGSLWIVFNGEMYNHAEQRERKHHPESLPRRGASLGRGRPGGRVGLAHGVAPEEAEAPGAAGGRAGAGVSQRGPRSL